MKSTMSLLAVAAAGANAIMLPPNVALESIHADVGTTTLIDPYTNVLDIACPGCPFAQPKQSGFVWVSDVENYLLLNISVGSNPASLELNGVQFYPPLITFSEPQTPSIPQIPASVSLSTVVAHPDEYTSHPLRLTSWSFNSGSANTVNDQGHEVVSIELHLGALEMHDIHVPDLSVTALKDTEGNLMILRVEQTQSVGSPLDKGKECTDWPLLCKWKEIVASKLTALKGMGKGRHGCKGKGKGMGMGMGHHGKPMIPAAGEKQHHHGHDAGKGGDAKHHKGDGAAWRKHHGHHHHHHHGHHSKLHRVLHAIARVLLTVLVPVLVGVAAGMMLYLVGYIVGSTLAFVVARVCGRRQSTAGYEIILAVGDEPRSETDKVKYAEEPPEYVEIEVEVEKA